MMRQQLSTWRWAIGAIFLSSDSYLGEMYFSSDPETGLFQVKVKLPFNAEIRESISG